MKKTGNSALWNMSEPILLVLKKFIVDEMERVQQNNQTNDIPLDVEKIDESDFKFISSFYKLFENFIYEHQDEFKPNALYIFKNVLRT